MSNKDQFSIAFHETFSLSRPAIIQILENAIELNKLNVDLLDKTNLGENYKKSMPKYAYRCGLLDNEKYLTNFGRFVIEHDPQLQFSGTQWLLHYHLAAPHRPTAFWHELVIRFFLPGNRFSADDLTKALTIFLHQSTGKIISPESIQRTITAFKGTYTKSDSLGNLGILEKISNNTYQVAAVPPPPLWAVGYALADYWQAHYEGRLTINLDDLIAGDFAGLFLLGEQGLNELLLELKREGMIDLYRIARPYQVVLLQPNPEYALERLYALA